MIINYSLFFVLMLFLIIFLIKSFIHRNKKIPDALYAEALRNENSGNFETAIISYEKALNEVNKTRFHKQFKSKIMEKLKVLHTTIEYNKGLSFHRYGD